MTDKVQFEITHRLQRLGGPQREPDMGFASQLFCDALWAKLEKNPLLHNS